MDFQSTRLVFSCKITGSCEGETNLSKSARFGPLHLYKLTSIEECETNIDFCSEHMVQGAREIPLDN